MELPLYHANTTPRVQISYFFTSHDHVHHVRIQWNNHPLLLFSDPQMVEALPVEHFRKQASHVTHQQHLQPVAFGSRAGEVSTIFISPQCVFMSVHDPCRKSLMLPPRWPAIGQNGLRCKDLLKKRQPEIST